MKVPVSAQKRALFGIQKRKQFEGKTAQREVGAWHANDNGIWMYRENMETCLLYTSPSPRDGLLSRMPSSA